MGRSFHLRGGCSQFVDLLDRVRDYSNKEEALDAGPLGSHRSLLSFYLGHCENLLIFLVSMSLSPALVKGVTETQTR